MSLLFDLNGLTSLAVVNDSPHVRAYLEHQMDPYPPMAGAESDTAEVVLACQDAAPPRMLLDVQGPAGDERRTGWDGERAYLLEDGLRFELPRLNRPGRVSLAYDGGFPVWRAFSDLVRPLLQIKTLEHQAVTVHGAAVETGAGAVVISGWSESGKTETALALAEAGGRFISDKWTILAEDRTVHAFPVPVGIREWVLRYLPRLRSSLRAGARGQLRAAALAQGATRPLLDRAGSGPIAGALAGQLQRLLALGARLSLRPSQVAAVYGASGDTRRTPTLRTLVLLTTVPDGKIDVRPADPSWAARRLARSAAFERRPLYELDARARYAEVDRDELPPAITEREREVLDGMLHGVQVLEVKAPFPADPRRVADALARWS